MSCHLVFPYEWLECPAPDVCDAVAHMDASAGTVNVYPQGWVKNLLGCSSLTDYHAEWKNDSGKFHRVDGPAAVFLDGECLWYVNGVLHREDGPAVMRPDGSQEWWANGKHHRVDGPAVVEADGSFAWYLSGKKHRVDGPAVVDADGSQEWWREDKRHRDGGPAIIFADGTQAWYQHGVLGRPEGGEPVIHSDENFANGLHYLPFP